MKICTTKTRLTEEEALQLASRDNSGLIGTFFNKLGHVPKEVSVLQIRKFYYPYYLEAAEAKLLRAAGLPTRRVVYTVAMEGGFGTVQQMKGRPATSYEEVDPSAVVVCKIDKAGADANVAKFIKRRAYKIFHQYHQLTRADTPVTAPFRRFLPFSPWRARARLRLKNQKSLEKSIADRCGAVLPEQKCVQTRKDPQGILAVLPRGLTQYGRISARQNRVCPCQLMVSAGQHTGGICGL